MIYVLTLNWNGLDKLQRLRPGLIRNLEATGQEWKWYIRDNGSTDGSKEWISKQDNIDLLDVDHNRDNFAEGVNSLWLKTLEWASKNRTSFKTPDGRTVIVKGRSIGPTTMFASQNDCILLLNNDVEFVDTESLKKMTNLIDSNPTIGAVGARLLYNKTTRLQHAGVIFGKQYGNMPYHFRHKEPSDANAENNRYFQAVTAACCLVRANCFERMDEKFSWAFEDIDLCLRIGKNWKIAYCGETNIYHEESASLKKNPVNKLFMSKNVKYFKEKWFGKYEIDHEKYLTDPNYNLIK